MRPLSTRLLPRQQVRQHQVYVYECPVCHNQCRYDDRYEPTCTGPHWTDDHPLEVMRLVSVEPPRVQLEIVRSLP